MSEWIYFNHGNENNPHIPSTKHFSLLPYIDTQSWRYLSIGMSYVLAKIAMTMRNAHSVHKLKFKSRSVLAVQISCQRYHFANQFYIQFLYFWTVDQVVGRLYTHWLIDIFSLFCWKFGCRKWFQYSNRTEKKFNIFLILPSINEPYWRLYYEIKQCIDIQ